MVEKYKRGPVGYLTVIPNGMPQIGKSLLVKSAIWGRDRDKARALAKQLAKDLDIDVVFANATGLNDIAIGTGATTLADNAVALGAGSVASDPMTDPLS